MATTKAKVERSIETPKGKFITPGQYVALVNRLKDGHVCVNGHFGCAGWKDGPCRSEIMVALTPGGSDEEIQNDAEALPVAQEVADPEIETDDTGESDGESLEAPQPTLDEPKRKSGIERSITTPNGKSMTPRYYLSRLSKIRAKSGAGFMCADGHLDCAAWDGGPCSGVVAQQIPNEPEKASRPRKSSVLSEARRAFKRLNGAIEAFAAALDMTPETESDVEIGRALGGWLNALYGIQEEGRQIDAVAE